MTEEELSALIDGFDYYLDHPSLTTTERTDIQRTRDVLSRIHAELFDESGEDQFMTTPTHSVRHTIDALTRAQASVTMFVPIGITTLNDAIAYLETIAPHPYDEMTMEQLFDEANEKGIVVSFTIWPNNLPATANARLIGDDSHVSIKAPTPLEALRIAMKEATK